MSPNIYVFKHERIKQDLRMRFNQHRREHLQKNDIVLTKGRDLSHSSYKGQKHVCRVKDIFLYLLPTKYHFFRLTTMQIYVSTF